MHSGAFKIAMGVVVAAMGAAMLPMIGVVAFVQIICGALLVWVGVKKLQLEGKPK